MMAVEREAGVVVAERVEPEKKASEPVVAPPVGITPPVQAQESPAQKGTENPESDLSGEVKANLRSNIIGHNSSALADEPQSTVANGSAFGGVASVPQSNAQSSSSFGFPAPESKSQPSPSFGAPAIEAASQQPPSLGVADPQSKSQPSSTSPFGAPAPESAPQQPPSLDVADPEISSQPSSPFGASASEGAPPQASPLGVPSPEISSQPSSPFGASASEGAPPQASPLGVPSPEISSQPSSPFGASASESAPSQASPLGVPSPEISSQQTSSPSAPAPENASQQPPPFGFPALEKAPQAASPFGANPLESAKQSVTTGSASATAPTDKAAHPFSDMFPSSTPTGEQQNKGESGQPESTVVSSVKPASSEAVQVQGKVALPVDSAAATTLAPKESKSTKKEKKKKERPIKPIGTRRKFRFGWVVKILFGLICAAAAAAAIRIWVPKSMFVELRQSLDPLIQSMPEPIQGVFGELPLSDNENSQFNKTTTPSGIDERSAEAQPDEDPPADSKPSPEEAFKLKGTLDTPLASSGNNRFESAERGQTDPPSRIAVIGEQVVRSFYEASTLEQRLPYLLEAKSNEENVRAFYGRKGGVMPKLRSITDQGPAVDIASDRWFGTYDVREEGDDSLHRWCVVEVRPGEYKIDWMLYQQLVDNSLPKFLSDPAAPDRGFRVLVKKVGNIAADENPFGPEGQALNLQMPLDPRPGRNLHLTQADYEKFHFDKELIGDSGKIVRLQLGWRPVSESSPQTSPTIQAVAGWGAW